MKKTRFLIATLLVVMATVVAVVSCKKERHDQNSNGNEQTVQNADNMDDYLMAFKKKLLSAVSKVCSDKDLDYVIDTGSQAYLVINPDRGMDISNSVFSLLGIENTMESVPNGGSDRSVIIIEQQESK